MNMKRLLLILFATTAFGALPPLAQGVREMQALLSDHRFYQALGSSEILKDVIRTDSGYLVLTQNYAMKVDVKYERRTDGVVGPVQFNLEFNPPVNLETGELKS